MAADLSKISGSSVVANGISSQSATLNKPPSQPTTNRKPCDKDYIFGKVIGEGSFSTVFLIKDIRTSKLYAMKVCDKILLLRERKSEYVRREREALCRLNRNECPFVIKLYATFQDDFRLFFVLSYAQHGELLPFINKVGSFNENCVRFYSAELLMAIEYIHSLDMIHRDIKPENILLDERMHVQLADFGSVRINGFANDDRYKEVSRRNSFVGTAQYVAPEILLDKEQTKSVDLWSFGCTMFQMSAGFPPIRASNEYLIFQKVMKAEYSFPDNFNPRVKSLLEKLLIMEPGDRLGANDPEGGGYPSIRNHPFFDGTEWENLHLQTPPTIAASSAKEREEITNEVTSENGDVKTTDFEFPDSLEPGLDDRQLSRLLGLDLRDYEVTNEISASGGGDKKSKEEDTDGSAVVKAFDYQMLTPEEIPCVINNLQHWLAYQANDIWHEKVGKNVILKLGMVSKRKGILAKPRILILTTGPHLFYFSNTKDQAKGEIAWTSHLRTEAKNFKLFVVRTPSRSYYLEDHNHQSQRWCDWINNLHKFYYPSTY